MQVQGGAYELDCSCHGFDKLLEYMRKGKLPPQLDVDDLVCKQGRICSAAL